MTVAANNAIAHGLVPVPPALRFDLEALDRYLSRHLAGYAGAPSLQQFEGGQSNPTFLLQSGEQSYVLRKKPQGSLLPTAHMVEREYRVYSALAGSAVPVPKTYLLCEDAQVIGTPFFIMEYVKGRSLRDPALPGYSPDERRAIYREMMQILAALHALDYKARGLADYGKPGNYFARQIKRWSTQYLAAKTRDSPAMDRLMQWLPENLPAEDTVSLVHGDYKLYNLVLHPSEPRILALLDWELSTLGHPLADLAYNCTKYHSDEAATLGEGIPSEAESIAMYCELTGRKQIPNWNFYVAFSFFRSASIGQGVYKRALQGNAASAAALAIGSTAAEHAENGWRVAQQG